MRDHRPVHPSTNSTEGRILVDAFGAEAKAHPLRDARLGSGSGKEPCSGQKINHSNVKHGIAMRNRAETEYTTTRSPLLTCPRCALIPRELEFWSCGVEELPQVEARPAGLEPATGGLEIRCSIQLSYGRLGVFDGIRFSSNLHPCRRFSYLVQGKPTLAYYRS